MHFTFGTIFLVNFEFLYMQMNTPTSADVSWRQHTWAHVQTLVLRSMWTILMHAICICWMQKKNLCIGDSKKQMQFAFVEMTLQRTLVLRSIKCILNFMLVRKDTGAKPKMKKDKSVLERKIDKDPMRHDKSSLFRWLFWVWDSLGPELESYWTRSDVHCESGLLPQHV